MKCYGLLWLGIPTPLSVIKVNGTFRHSFGRPCRRIHFASCYDYLRNPLCLEPVVFSGIQQHSELCLGAMTDKPTSSSQDPQCWPNSGAWEELQRRSKRHSQLIPLMTPRCGTMMTLHRLRAQQAVTGAASNIEYIFSFIKLDLLHRL